VPGGSLSETMRLPLAAFSLFAFISAANAEPKDLAVDSGPPKQSPREVALDNLLSERDSDQALESVIKEAKANGIKEQAILEARFLYHIDRREDDAIAAMLPEFIKQQGLFKIEDSAIFSVKEDWLAVTEYVQAIASLKKGDKDAFKSHITEAFWLSPRQASAFAPQIDRLRLEESMRSVKIDFETRLIALREGDAIALKSLMQDKKAMIFHFWSPASRECEATLPDFVITAKHLSGKGIAVVSILSDSTPQIITDARAMIQPLGPEAPGAWLIDQKENPLVRELRVQSLPIFVLFSNEGKILFNGDPSDDGLWDALKKVDPLVVRPEITDRAE
jgi:hypothetical protein